MEETKFENIQTSQTDNMNQIKRSFIKITQDGYARLSLDNTDYDGLSTDGLETCFGLFIKGENGVVLFHDKGSISKETIEEQAKWSKILFWRVAMNKKKYNMNHLDRPEDLELLQHLQNYILKLEGILGKDRLVYPLIQVDCFVSFDKQGNHADQYKPDVEYFPPKNESERETINWLNFTFNGHKDIAGDLQYDAETLTLNSEFHKPLKNKQDLDDFLNELFQYMERNQTMEFSRVLMLLFISPAIWISLLVQKNSKVKEFLFAIINIGYIQVPSFFEKNKQKTLEKIKYCLEGMPITLKIQESLKTSIIEKKHLDNNLEYLCKTVYNLKDTEKSSIERAFRRAAVNNQLEDVKILGSVIQDMNAENEDKKTALIYAQERGHKKVAEYLKELFKQK